MSVYDAANPRLTEITKLEAALIQFDCAVSLFFDHHQPIPAITLAGAADELLGKLVPPNKRNAFDSLKAQLMVCMQLDERTVVRTRLNHARDWFKHCGAGVNESKTFNLEGEALRLLLRAWTNLLHIDINLFRKHDRLLRELAKLSPKADQYAAALAEADESWADPANH